MKFTIDKKGNFKSETFSIESDLEFDLHFSLTFGYIFKENYDSKEEENYFDPKPIDDFYDDDEFIYDFWDESSREMYATGYLPKEIIIRDFSQNIKNFNFYDLEKFYKDSSEEIKELFNKLYKEGIKITSRLKGNISETERYININGYKYLVSINTDFKENLFEDYDKFIKEKEETIKQIKLERQLRKEAINNFFNSIDETQLYDKKHKFRYKDELIIRYYYEPDYYDEKIYIKKKKQEERQEDKSHELTEEQKRELENYYKYLEYEWEHSNYDDYYDNNDCDTLNEDDDDYWLGRYHLD